MVKFMHDEEMARRDEIFDLTHVLEVKKVVDALINSPIQQIVELKCQEFSELGLIQPSESEYAAATVLPPKKDEFGVYTEKQMCGDYRPLNAVTPLDRYPMPTPEEIFDAIGDCKIFTTLDLRQGFNQLEIADKDKRKTTFWGNRCLWEWTVMPFRLKNAPSAFQRFMDQILRGLPFARCYIDDILIFSKTVEEHKEHVKMVLDRI